MQGRKGNIVFDVHHCENSYLVMIKLPISIGSLKKQESSRKTSALLTMLKPLTVWITTNWKILKLKKRQLESDREQQTGSKLGKEDIKAVYIVTLLI